MLLRGTANDSFLTPQRKRRGTLTKHPTYAPGGGPKGLPRASVQKSEVRSQKSEVRVQKSDRQKAARSSEVGSISKILTSEI